MRAFAILLFSASLLPGCASHRALSQNLGHAHKVKRGMTAEQAEAIMGAPYHAPSFAGVDEWRYCDTRSGTDEYVVLYFQNGRVIDKTSYTFSNPSINISDARIGECHDRTELYVDRRSPPRRVRELRDAFRARPSNTCWA
jgi:hypothetical protein